MKVPAHIAIIMDGNGRWAREKGLPRTEGHREGVKRVKEIIREAGPLGVKSVIFYAFSTENWTRPKAEIQVLMRFLGHFLDKEVEDMHRNNVRFQVIGEGAPVPERLQKKIRGWEERTQHNTGLHVILAINYGSRQEIVSAAKRFARDAQAGALSIDALTPERFDKYLYTAGIPDIDLLIRTSGEMRISNFLLWQLSYAELYFVKKYWPDFHKVDLEEAIRQFQGRERRFGNIC